MYPCIHVEEVVCVCRNAYHFCVCVCLQLLMLIGGGMEQFDDVNGVVVSRRKKGDRIALWTRRRTTSSSLKVW